MRTKFADYEIRNMREDAMNALNMFSAILKELEGPYVSPRYIGEKITKARHCLDYITSCVFQEEDHD